MANGLTREQKIAARIAAHNVRQGKRYIRTGKRLDKKAGGIISQDTKARTRKAALVETSRNFETAGKHQVDTGTKATTTKSDGTRVKATRLSMRMTPKGYTKAVYAATGHSTPGNANLGRRRRK